MLKISRQLIVQTERNICHYNVGCCDGEDTEPVATVNKPVDSRKVNFAIRKFLPSLFFFFRNAIVLILVISLKLGHPLLRNIIESFQSFLCDFTQIHHGKSTRKYNSLRPTFSFLTIFLLIHSE